MRFAGHERSRVPEISRLYDEGKYGAAFVLATRAEKAIPGDPALAKLWPVISYQMSVNTTPEGVDVYRREYDDPNCAMGAGRKDAA